MGGDQVQGWFKGIFPEGASLEVITELAAAQLQVFSKLWTDKLYYNVDRVVATLGVHEVRHPPGQISVGKSSKSYIQ